MYRTYKQSAGEKVTPNRLVQVLENNTIADLPKIRKGITIKLPKANSYIKGANTLNIIDGNKIITIVDNILYIAKYENYEFIELETIELEKKNGIYYKSKILSLSENKSVIVQSNGSSIYCYVIYIDEKNGINKLSSKFIVTSNTGSRNVDVIALTPNKIVISYTETIEKSPSNYMGRHVPFVTVANINNEDKMSISQEAFQIPDFIENNKRVERMFVTKLSDTEFIGTFNFSSDNDANVVSRVFKIDYQDAINAYESLNYKGYHSNMISYAVKPLYVSDNKVITFEFLNWNCYAVLREIKQNINTGVYTFDTLSSIKPNVYFSINVHNVDYLRENEDKSRDYMIFNQQVININKSNDILTLVAAVPKYAPAKVLSYMMNILPTINLENDLLLTLNNENNFQMVKYDEYEGNFLGIVKRRWNDG